MRLAIDTKPSGLHCSYRWRIDDRDCLNNFLLVRLRAGSVEVTNDRGHTGLVAHDGRQVDGLLGVILIRGNYLNSKLPLRLVATYLRECLDLSAVARSPLAGQETKGAVAGGFVLKVGLTSTMFPRPQGTRIATRRQGR